MTDLTQIKADIATLSANVSAAYPLAQAPQATLQLLRLQAAAVVNEVQAALIADDALVTEPAYTDARAYIKQIGWLVAYVLDQSKLADLRGFVGRVEANLDEVGV